MCIRDVVPKLQPNVLQDQTEIKQNMMHSEMELGVCMRACVCSCVCVCEAIQTLKYSCRWPIAVMPCVCKASIFPCRSKDTV